MKIVVVHNFYQQPGGEDQVFADETALLEAHGHTVIRWTVHNRVIDDMPSLTVAGRTIWNRSAHRELRELVARERADVVHFHNTFPLLSPAVYDAASGAGAAVVQTLHNYRFICPTGIFFRDGHPCEECMGKSVPWPSVVHGCYRGSRRATAVVAAMLTVHRVRGTYRNDVDAYIALSKFSREKLIEAGLPAGKIVVKPNFVSPDPGLGHGGGGYALFVGRLNEGKGIGALLAGWKKLAAPVQLKIVGDGELADAVRGAAASDPRIEWLGRRPLPEVYQIMGEASALIFPSVWYEGMPKTIIESFAKGTPVIASRYGSMAEMIRDGQTGLHFTAGDAADLAAAVTRGFSNPALLQSMRPKARAEFESLYTADQNYRMLEKIYTTALHRRTPVQQAPVSHQTSSSELLDKDAMKMGSLPPGN